MKKLILIAFLFIATPAWAVRSVGWTPEDQARWTAMKEANHHFYQVLKSKADDPVVHADFGYYDAMLYKIMGQFDYARRAWAHVQSANWRGKSHYNLTGVVPHNDIVRYHMVALVEMFSWMCSGEERIAECRDFKDILDFWTDLALQRGEGDNYKIGIRSADSDRTNSSYFGTALYAEVIRDEYPQEADAILSWCGPMNIGSTDTWCHGGLDNNAAPVKSARRLINDYWTKFDGGVYIESSLYNLTGATFPIRAAEGIRELTGIDYFPEITNESTNYALATLAAYVPDFNGLFIWGDGSVDLYYGNRSFAIADFLGMAARVSEDENLNCWYNTYVRSIGFSTAGLAYLKHLDPAYDGCTPQPLEEHYAAGRGLLFKKYLPQNSFFVSSMFNATRDDHEIKRTADFNLWQNGEWVIPSVKGYFAPFDGSYTNGLLAFAALTHSDEARGPYAWDTGENWSYHVGGYGGIPGPAGQWGGADEMVHESTTEHFSYSWPDGTQTVIVFDRLQTCGNYSNSAECKFTGYSKFSVLKKRIENYNGRHQFAWNVYGDITAEGGLDSPGKIWWSTPKAVPVFLKPILNQPFHVDYYDLCTEYSSTTSKLVLSGHTPDQIFCERTWKQIRLVTYDVSPGYKSFLNVFNTGKDLSVLPVIEDGVKGVAVNNDLVVIFNDEANPPPPPTPRNSKTVHSPDRHAQNQRVRLHKTSFSFEIDAKAGMNLFVTDLDPSLSWYYSIETVNPRRAQVLQFLTDLGVEAELVSAALNLMFPDSVYEEPHLIEVPESGVIQKELIQNGKTKVHFILAADLP